MTTEFQISGPSVDLGRSCLTSRRHSEFTKVNISLAHPLLACLDDRMFCWGQIREALCLFKISIETTPHAAGGRTHRYEICMSSIRSRRPNWVSNNLTRPNLVGDHHLLPRPLLSILGASKGGTETVYEIEKKNHFIISDYPVISSTLSAIGFRGLYFREGRRQLNGHSPFPPFRFVPPPI